ncbi:GFA family protein [Stigmatella sp. ncwal1]|uniref:GFA family protein n=1 Tax=Stigmatella ashevillensis TaxID=2995309 RepID=A0ABT5D3W9_9BACT|nr:GFA family protein [Stigmatella ashevillena]MDC0707538.1 GFA family protein [Stigmatella ashevillena]
MNAFKGGCQCGAIRFEVNSDPVAAGACYCRDCQYASGGGPAYAISLPRAGVTLTQGTPRVYWSAANSGARVARHFCGDCGTPLFAENAAYPEVFSIKAGSLDDPSRFVLGGSIWVSSAQPWHLIDPHAVRFDKNPWPGG